MKNALLSLGLGFSLIFLTALTGDQILQDVYDSGTASLNVTLSGSVPAGSITVGTTTISGGTSGRALYDNAGVLGELANPVTGTGANTRVALWSGASTLSSDTGLTFDGTNLTEDASGYVSAGYFCAGNQVKGNFTVTAGDTGNATGTFEAKGATSGTVSIKSQAVAGTYNFNLPTSAGSSGQYLISGGGGSTAQSYTSLGSFTDLSYSGKLTIAGVDAENASFTVDNRIEYVTTGASAIAATTPASPTVGDTYTIVKADAGAGTVVWTRAGSQTLNGATTRTIDTQYQSDTCVYMASDVWICQGDGA